MTSPPAWFAGPRWGGKQPPAPWSPQRIANMRDRKKLGDADLGRKLQARVDGDIVGPCDWVSGQWLLGKLRDKWTKKKPFRFYVEERDVELIAPPPNEKPKKLRANHMTVLGWVVTAHLAMRKCGLAITLPEFGALVGLCGKTVGRLVRDLVEQRLLELEPIFERYGKVCSRRQNLYRVTELAAIRFSLPVAPGVMLAAASGGTAVAALLSAPGNPTHGGVLQGPVATSTPTRAQAPAPAPGPAVPPLPDRKKRPSNVLPTPERDSESDARARAGNRGASRVAAAVVSAHVAAARGAAGSKGAGLELEFVGAGTAPNTHAASTASALRAATVPVARAVGAQLGFAQGRRPTNRDRATWSRARDHVALEVSERQREAAAAELAARARPEPLPAPAIAPEVPALLRSIGPEILTDEERAAARRNHDERAELRRRDAYRRDEVGMDLELAALIEGACVSRFGVVPLQISRDLDTVKNGGAK